MEVHKEKPTPYLLFAVSLAALGGLLFGYHTAVISGALLFVATHFHLSIVDQGVVVSVLLLGCIAGSWIGGILADRMGRRKTLMIAAVVFVIGALLLAVSPNYAWLLIGRIVSGGAVGLVSLAAPLYIAEISPPRLRGSFVSLYQLAITIGIVFSFLVDYFLSSQGSWRWMFLIGALPACVQGICLSQVGETPPWLMKQGRKGEAIALLQKLREGKNWMNQIEGIQAAALQPQAGGWKILLNPKLRFVLLIGLFLSGLQQITGINTVIYYAPTIFEFAGIASASSAIAATVAVGIVNVLATIVAVYLLDRVGRRLLLIIGVVGMTLSLALLSLSFLLPAVKEMLALVSLMGYVSAFAISLGPVTWVLLSEIYPLKIRSRAMTLAIFANWSCNYLVSLTFLDLVHHWGPEGTFLLYALISGVGLWFIVRFIPETRGKSLEEIESIVLH